MSSLCCLAVRNNVGLIGMNMFSVLKEGSEILLLIARSFSMPSQKTRTSHRALLHYFSPVSPRVPCAFSDLLRLPCCRVRCPLGSFGTHQAPVLLACDTSQGPRGGLPCESALAQVSKWRAEGMREPPQTRGDLDLRPAISFREHRRDPESLCFRTQGIQD